MITATTDVIRNAEQKAHNCLQENSKIPITSSIIILANSAHLH